MVLLVTIVVLADDRIGLIAQLSPNLIQNLSNNVTCLTRGEPWALAFGWLFLEWDGAIAQHALKRFAREWHA
ncbi:hypothetical protein OX89_05170 [Diaphorobacter sp. J5-51]|nr:hypothetical protein OX89_05170 [Diaphorobacter sp. J5-51]